MNKILIVICTRPDSRRLPGKALRRIAGLSAIEHILVRVRGTYPVILAVPTGCEDYQYLLAKYPIRIYHGEDHDPLRRMINAAKELLSDATHVVRITHDDLLIDAEEMISLVDEVGKQGAGYGYSSGILDGCGVEVIAWENLIAASQRATGPIEHISYFVKGTPPNPKIVAHQPRSAVCRPYHLTMDYPEDEVALKLVLGKLGETPHTEEICEFLDLHPEILQINKRPRLTVYTCAKNAQAFVAKAIESVLMNPFDDMEYVFVDDGSTDDTALIAARYTRRDKPFKLLLNDGNKGLASSSNHAVAQARGEYVLRLDADDMFLPMAIPTLVHEMDITGADIVYPDYRVIGEQIAGGEQLGEVVSGRVHHHAGGAIMRRQFINALWFREGLKWWDSLELYHRAKVVGKIGYLHIPAFYYRQHDGNLTKQDPVERQRAAYDLELTTTASMVETGEHFKERQKTEEANFRMMFDMPPTRMIP